MVTTHFHLVQMLRITGANPTLMPTWCVQGQVYFHRWQYNVLTKPAGSLHHRRNILDSNVIIALIGCTGLTNAPGKCTK